LRLKTESFVVESNVHFPSDYNLSWDCARKCLDTVSAILNKLTKTSGWRKINDWHRYKVDNWSFDKGFFFKENKELLMEQIPKVIMPKKGKCNKAEREEETTLSFTKQRRKHSAVESNINELEQKQGIKSLSR
jgi:hypothetical protein